MRACVCGLLGGEDNGDQRGDELVITKSQANLGAYFKPLKALKICVSYLQRSR